MINSIKRTPSQLDSSTLVAMGHIVCGAKPTEMNIFNAVEFRWANTNQSLLAHHNVFEPCWLSFNYSTADHTIIDFPRFASLWCTVSPPGGCSKAVLWLGHLRLPCSEEQLLSLVGLLSHSLAFGHMSSWGPDVFIEIGALAGMLHTVLLLKHVFIVFKKKMMPMSILMVVRPQYC